MVYFRILSLILVAAGSTETVLGGGGGEGNLSCYQCTKTTNTEPCEPDTLQPCPPNRDRCVTHLSKDATNGLVVKKECGLGPCGFNDDMVNKGLGLDTCDTSKEEFFCIFCCTESGCNRGGQLKTLPSPLLLLLAYPAVYVIIRAF